jgi:glycerol uptake facilitator protein
LIDGGGELSNFLSETIGTALLILMGNGVVACVLLAQSKGQNSGWIVITFGWGFAVMTGVYCTAGFSGAHLNPAVTVGLAVAGSVEWSDTPQYFAGEFLGAFIGATLVWLAYYDHWKETEDPGLKLACFSTAPAIRNYPMNVLTEVIGTFVLVFFILAEGSQGKGVPSVVTLGGLLVAFLVVGIGLSLGGPTGYAINPARDLGPRIMHAILPIAGKGGSDWGYSWVPVVGPLIGAVIAALAWKAFYP